jgi:hypothetical protein
MDHIGIDVHRKESQICILGAEGEIIERPSAPRPSGSPRPGRPPSGPHFHRGLDGERMGRAVLGRVGP